MKQNKSAKRSLAFSVLSLLLCCAMLVGTTFAWFTDSVTSGNNKIVAGNLDVELYHNADANVTTINNKVDETKINNKVTATTELFEQTLWEPGVAVFENFKVANEGTLALKYQLMVNFTNAVKTPSGKTLADVLKVGVVEGGVSGNRDAVVGAVTTWEPLATFALEGDLMANENDVYGIVIWWEPSDIDDEFNMNNENKGTVLSIDLGVSLIATQVEAESDPFGDDYDASTTLPELIQDNEELNNALTADVEHIVVNLANDVTWDVAAWANNAMGGASTRTITINAHGYTINFNHTNSDWNNITAGEGIVLTINNAHITNSGYNNGPWNRHDLNFACEVVMNNVTSDKAMAFKNSATLNNVTIDDANTSDTYAIWVSPRTEGQTITLDNCVIDMLDCTDGRGIKIDNQYVNAADEKLVTLNVSNTTFKTEEKSAILVKTTLGANITLNNVDIANTLDPLHEVWVDEAAAAAYDLVTVTGGEKILESDMTVSSEDLDEALVDGETVELQLGAGTYTLPSVSNSDVTISGSKKTVITVTTPAYHGSNVTFNGVTVKGSGYATGVQHVNTVTYNDATIVGVMCLYGEKVVFNNCTFDLTAVTDYVWTYGAKEVEFNNCIFNTNGKAILIYNEGADLVTKVSVKGCTFNATASALDSGNVAAAIEIDSSLSANGHYTLTTQNNTVDSDFCGEWRIKKSGSNNTTVNGTVYNAVTIDGKLVAYTAADLQEILGNSTNGQQVALNSDVTIADTGSRLTMNGGSFDGNGKTVTYNGGMLTTGTSTMSAPVLTTKGGSISNLTVEASNNGRALYVTTLTEDLYVANCVLSGAYSFNLNSNNVTDYTINFSNTEFKSWVSYANVVKVANFENCVFEGNLRPYADTVLTNCQFNGDGTLDLVKLASGETITLTGCTQNGAALTVVAIEAMQGGANMADYTVVENAGVITITRN